MKKKLKIEVRKEREKKFNGKVHDSKYNSGEKSSEIRRQRFHHKSTPSTSGYSARNGSECVRLAAAFSSLFFVLCLTKKRIMPRSIKLY